MNQKHYITRPRVRKAATTNAQRAAASARAAAELAARQAALAAKLDAISDLGLRTQDSNSDLGQLTKDNGPEGDSTSGPLSSVLSPQSLKSSVAPKEQAT